MTEKLKPFFDEDRKIYFNKRESSKKNGIKSYLFTYRKAGCLGLTKEECEGYVVFSNNFAIAHAVEHILFELKLWNNWHHYGCDVISENYVFGLSKCHIGFDEVKNNVENRKRVYYAYVNDGKLYVDDYENKKTYSCDTKEYCYHPIITTVEWGENE